MYLHHLVIQYILGEWILVGKMKTQSAKAKGRKNIPLGTLKKVYRRGQGAFLSSGSRPRTSMASWSMGRVNSFLRGSRKHDTDLRKKRKK